YVIGLDGGARVASVAMLTHALLFNGGICCGDAAWPTDVVKHVSLNRFEFAKRRSRFLFHSSNQGGTAAFGRVHRRLVSEGYDRVFRQSDGDSNLPSGAMLEQAIDKLDGR
ncbi:MAG: hypothetical protein N2C14_04895, partial [Planctomycetales bacterium]